VNPNEWRISNMCTKSRSRVARFSRAKARPHNARFLGANIASHMALQPRDVTRRLR